MQLDRERIQESLGLAIQELSEEERKSLSKVLFPDTHTNEITVGGKKRTLRPLPVKWTRQVSHILQEFNQKTSGSEDEVASDLNMLDALIKVVRILAEYYKWDDLLDDPESLNIGEIQSLVYTQTELNGANDFLLSRLFMLVKQMQTREVLQLRLKSMSTTQLLSLLGTSASTS